MDQTEEPKEPLLQFFSFDHLPPHLAGVSGEFYGLACTTIAHTSADVLERLKLL